MVTAIPADGSDVVAAPVGCVEIKTPELLKFSVPDATVVVAPAGAGFKLDEGIVTL
jgi:hypothetical protein